MVSRTKISKEIRRRTGGAGVTTGKGTDVRDIKVGGKKGAINRPGDWIPNPKYNPGNPYSGEAPMIRNPATKNRKKKAERTKASEEIRLKAAKEKARKNRIARLQKETAAKADKGRKARKAESEKPRGISVRTTPVKTKTLAAPHSSTVQKLQREGAKKGQTSSQIASAIAAQRKADTGGATFRPIDREREARLRAERQADHRNQGGRGSGVFEPQLTSAEIVRQRNEQRKRERELAKLNKGPLDDLLVEKTGGKVSRYKGGKVKKAQGHKKKTKKTYGGHHGNKYVASLYD